jgi:hypothetical protein
VLRWDVWGKRKQAGRKREREIRRMSVAHFHPEARVLVGRWLYAHAFSTTTVGNHNFFFPFLWNAVWLWRLSENDHLCGSEQSVTKSDKSGNFLQSALKNSNMDKGYENPNVLKEDRNLSFIYDTNQLHQMKRIWIT